MPKHSTYKWNDRTGRYHRANGRIVSFGTIRGYLDEVLDRSEREMLVLSSRLQSGGASIEEWQLGMRDSLKSIHTASGALPQGGWAHMSPADYGRVGVRLKEQYKFLGNFASQVERGLPLDGRFFNRVKLYAQSGRATYHAIEREEQAKRGMTEERTVLGGKDHCTECVSEAAKGWVPIGALMLIGQRICKSNCRCHAEYQ